MLPVPLLRRHPEPSYARGQSLVELALILPLLLIMALAVFDFARAFATAITIESAAREAADFGGLYPWHWDSADPAAIPATEQEMETRACTSASNLSDYAGDDPDSPPAPGVVECTNPTVTYTLLPDPANTPNCYDVPRDQVPCRVEVTVTHEFEVIVPLRLRFGDTVLGLPESVTIERTSTFAVSNFEIDEPTP
jgi:TadE-like protein